MSLDPGLPRLMGPQDLLDKLRHDFVRLRRTPGDAYLAYDFFTTAAHLPSWIEVAGGPNACQLPSTPLLKAIRQIADGEAPIRPAGTAPRERYLVIVLDGWPARELGETVKALDLASRVLLYWETLDFFADGAGAE